LALQGVLSGTLHALLTQVPLAMLQIVSAPYPGAAWHSASVVHGAQKLGVERPQI